MGINRQRIYPNLAAWLEAHPDQTITDLAHDLGVGVPFLSMIKWGQREPRLGLALELTKRCNIPLESLLKRTA